MPHKLNRITFQLKDFDLALEIHLLDHQLTVAPCRFIQPHPIRFHCRHDNERINDESAAYSLDYPATDKQHPKMSDRVHVRLGLERALLSDM